MTKHDSYIINQHQQLRIGLDPSPSDKYSMKTTRARTTPGVGPALALVLSDLALMGTSLL